jgi:hypothetical protein
MVKRFLIFICTVFSVFGQEASDYYNRPVQEIMEKIPGQIQDTGITHSGGFLQSFYEIQNWADKKRNDAHFKSIAFLDSLGTVQLVLHSDCQTLRSTGPQFEYYMGLISFSKSIKIEFWNIDYKKKDCDKIFRKSLENEVASLTRSFVDSTLYIHKPCRGLQVASVPHRFFTDSFPQNEIDSVFECVKKDSIIHFKDSLNAVTSITQTPETPKIDLDSARRVLDSLSIIVDIDSVSLYHAELSFFKTGHTTQISCKGKIDIGIRLECVNFLLSNKLRSSVEISKYLIMLYKFCIDKSHMIKAVIVTLQDDQKWKAVSAYHRAQEVCGLICQKQKELDYSSVPVIEKE